MSKLPHLVVHQQLAFAINRIAINRVLMNYQVYQHHLNEQHQQLLLEINDNAEL
jgi:hypothetical protein